MAYTATMVAQFIRGLGYRAIPSGNDTAIDIPLAIDAGLGELGRNGLLITEKYGPKVRISKVFTELPLVPDEPVDFGVTRFCLACEKCAKHCPSQAILYGDRTIKTHNISNARGELKWPINAEKCLAFWSRNEGSCMNCIRVCPFNKPKGWFHDVVRWLIKHTPFLDSFIVKMDDLVGYGKQKKLKFWSE
jgi:reductive dehalogenase